MKCSMGSGLIRYRRTSKKFSKLRACVSKYIYNVYYIICISYVYCIIYIIQYTLYNVYYYTVLYAIGIHDTVFSV